ncbi:hypothetical protein [Cyclobacterium plantarum]|uniref:hypothetical protein n=1 Tax=Cyclobacterium plantarum TaxID=2716263 RepID=UPI003F72B05A
MSKRYFSIPIIIIAVCIFGLLSALLRPYDTAILDSGSTSERLQYAYETDQDDRKQLKSYIPYLSKLKERDDLRLNLAKRIDEGTEDLKPIDQFYAAFIFHHSDNSNDYETASKLASEAANARHLQDHYLVQWLNKAAYDRWMVSMGKAEKYNTQNKFSIEID